MNDHRYKYNADGTLKANDFAYAEILLTEVSSGYVSNNAGKIIFDHYKAMFGMLAMIRTVALGYNNASFNAFTKLKIHFLHGNGRSIRHWTMSTPAPGIYIMTKEQRVDVPISFSEKDITLDPFLCFFKTLAHKTAYRSKDKKHYSLCKIISLVIIRLNEKKKHASIVVEHGPLNIPSSPTSG
ncbi:hypothetical protein CLU79DRAFT_806658 [Phycomyces nitens]|nr:hypothetical protein CLU79DRAFT_806658 [Phycomyces nitens]